MMLYVRNDAAHPGVIVAAKIERTDGLPTVTMLGPSVSIGTPSTPEWVAYIPLSGPIARLHPDAPEPTRSEESGVFLECAVDFTDTYALVTWRQHVRLYERVSFPVTREEAGTGVSEPLYSYDSWERPEPEIVSARDSLTTRPVGWVRRNWRRFW